MREGISKIHGSLTSHSAAIEKGEMVTSDYDISQEGDLGIETSEQIAEKEKQERIHGHHIDIDFKKLYQTKHDLEDELELVSSDLNARVEEMTDSLTEEELERLYVEVMLRIQNETNYFYELEEMGIFENVLDYELGDNFGLKKVGGVRVKWKTRMLQSGGLYDNTFRTAFIREEKPTREKILKKMAQKGKLPGRLRTVFHEIIHSYQFSGLLFDRYQIIFQDGRPNNTQELREVQAYKNEGNSRKGSTKRGIIDHIYDAEDKKGRLLYPGVNKDKLIYATEVIDQLDALGFSPQEIGKIIQTEMMPKKQGYARLMVVQKMLDLGLDENDLENLVQADKAERQIAQLQAIKIVREELDKIRNN